MASTVTIEKAYFDALLRRAEFYTTGPANKPPVADSIAVGRDEYYLLVQQAREYSILRSALLRGGLNESTLDLLISGTETQDQQDNECTFARPAPVSVTLSRDTSLLYPTSTDPSHTNIRSASQPVHNSWGGHRSYSFDAAESAASQNDREDACMPDDRDGRSFLPSHDQRTLLFTNLPDRTTHAELVNLIKGGRLLDIYIRNDRTAIVSFVEGAADYMSYVKRNDVYLRTKRIEVKWNDRQFRLLGHVATKINSGATRNIVIRNGLSKNLTEVGIREDLEHIHNLIVISVLTNRQSGDIFISTNSIHNALFARTCMMSRALYKGLKIEWYPDECAETLPKLAPKITPPAGLGSNKASKKPQTRANLFELLDRDDAGSEDDSDCSSQTESQAISGYDNGVKINWADSIAVA